MKEDGLTKLLVDALLCDEPRQKEALWKKASEIEEARIRAQMNKERKARIRRHFQALLTKKETAKLPMTEEPMMQDFESGLAFRWMMTDDKQEFMEVGRKLFPEATDDFFGKAFEDSYKTGS